ncbi:protein LYRIC-like isoform X2 [Anguilla anguilla]|uniref:protein LYRIC-like isoform X2 n=1 Tax=Anguilla anguilla TaxID=7936 RepID=UPI0015ACEC17|nr:protein LYRIC-like isoform X2 [Anguilla anguilla]
MFGLLVRSVFEAGQDIFRGSVLSEIVQQWIGSNFLTLVSVLLGGVVFFVIVSFRRRGQRGISSTFTVDFNNADVSLEQVLQTPFRLTVKRSRQDPTKKKRKEKERDQPNGHPAAAPDGSIADSEATRSPARPDGKPLKPKKKKRKTDVSEKRVVLLSNDLFSTKDRTEEEETGVWERKMSSREKRQMRKERMKRKENPRGGSQQRPPMAEIRWNVPPHPEGEWQPRPSGGEPRGPEARSTGGPPRREGRPQEPGKAEKTSRRAVEWAPPSGLEEDIFSHVGTWDSKDVKAEPVTFGTVPDLSSDFGNGSSLPSAPREEWSAQTASLGVEDAWLSLEDPSELDQTSDWKPPREEWGNWAGEDGALGQEAGQTPMVKKTGRRRGE